jgi:hypothetical protein
MFFLQQNWRTRWWSRFCLEVREEEALMMPTHVNVKMIK